MSTELLLLKAGVLLKFTILLLHVLRNTSLPHSKVVFLLTMGVWSMAIQNVENKQQNIANRNTNFFLWNLSAIAPLTVFTNSPVRGKIVYIRPTVTAAYPLCLAIVGPNIINGATPEVKFSLVLELICLRISEIIRTCVE